MPSRNFPTHQSLVVASDGIQVLVRLVQLHAHNVRRMPTERDCLASLQTRAFVNVHETPVIPSIDKLSIVASLHSINMSPTRSRREDALDIPSYLPCLTAPSSVSKLCCSICHLRKTVDIPKEQLIGSTDRLDVLAIFRPIDSSDE